LNSTLKLIGKHETGMCEVCNINETVDHRLLLIVISGGKDEAEKLV